MMVLAIGVALPALLDPDPPRVMLPPKVVMPPVPLKVIV